MPGLIKRSVAVASSVIGLLEIFLGTALAICGFIVLGLYRNLSGIGLWAGLPLLVPGLLSMVLLATRHKNSAYAFLLCSIGALCLCAGHAVKTWRDTEDWDKSVTEFDNSRCYDRVDKCVCVTERLKDFFVQRCDLYVFGFELYWAMVGISIAGVVVTLIGSILGAVAACSDGDPVKKYEEKQRYAAPVPEYPDDGRRFDYYVSS